MEIQTVIELWQRVEKSEKRLLLFGAMLSTITFAMSAFLPKTIDWVSQALKNKEHLGPVIWKIVGILIIAACCSYLNYLVQVCVNERIALKMRKDLAVNFITADLESQERIENGYLNALMINDVNESKEVLTRGITLMLPSAVAFLVIVFIMFVFDPILMSITSLMVLALILTIALFSILVSRKAVKSRKAMATLSEKATALLDESLLVKCESAEEFQISRFVSEANKLYKSRIKQSQIEGIGSPINAVLFPLLLILILIIGFVRIQSGSGTITSLLTFIGYAFILLIPIGNMVSFFTYYSKAIPSLNKINEFISEVSLNVYEGKVNGFTGISNSSAIEVFEIKELSYVYFGGNTVLGPLNLDLKIGNIVILRGENGVGKSTLLKLVAGLYSPRNPKLCNRDLIHLIPQNNLLISGTICDNVLFSDNSEMLPHIDLSKIGLSSSQFNSLTTIGTMGLSPSGGESKRISWLRLIYSNSKYFILDEPTAGVDTSGRELLIDILKDKITSAGMLIVTHDQAFIAELEANFPCETRILQMSIP